MPFDDVDHALGIVSVADVVIPIVVLARRKFVSHDIVLACVYPKRGKLVRRCDIGPAHIGKAPQDLDSSFMGIVQRLHTLRIISRQRLQPFGVRTVDIERVCAADLQINSALCCPASPTPPPS